MIEEPPVLRILGEAKRPRPTAALVALFEGAETGHLCDAMGGSGALHPAIKPLGRTGPCVVGPALTLDCGPADILALWGGLTEARPGDVLVMATDMHQGCASFGDQVCAMARNAGVAGIVSDGMARDIDGIEGVGLPVYAQGISPHSPFSNGPGRVGFPVICGGRQVASGDIVVADRNGVVIVPRADAEAVAAALVQIRAAEAATAARVKDGMVCPDAFRDLVAGPRTTRL